MKLFLFDLIIFTYIIYAETVYPSLSGGLIRLMMAGCVFKFFPISSFWLQFVVSEFIGRVSANHKEVLQMIIRFYKKVKSFVNQLKEVISSFILRHPYGVNPLMNW